MKHLKLMMAALAMMMGLTMTSCFDDEDSYETVITSIAKLKQGLTGGYEFVTTEAMHCGGHLNSYFDEVY